MIGLLVEDLKSVKAQWNADNAAVKPGGVKALYCQEEQTLDGNQPEHIYSVCA